MTATTMEQPTKTVVSTSECDIAYCEVGEGPALLCLHGGGPGSSGWSNFARNADHFASDYRVIMPDVPCWGGSRIRDDADSGEPVERVAARAMAELLAELGVGHAHVLGNSSGGGIGARMAIEHPQAIDKLVLMGGWMPNFALPIFSPTPTEGTKHLLHYYPEPSIEKMRSLILTFIHDPSGIDVDSIVQARYEASIEPNAIEGRKRAYGDFSWPEGEPPVAEQLKKIESPTLLVQGRDDRFCGLDLALQFLGTIPDCRLMFFRDCGHWVQVEKREEFNAVVSAFLEL